MVEGQPPSAGAFRPDIFSNIQITDSANDANITLKFENGGRVALGVLKVDA
jgi:hypothetical protein